MPLHSPYMSGMNELLRHIRACNNAILPGSRLPGSRLPVLLGAERVGWVLPDLAQRAADHGAALGPDGLRIPAYALAKLARALASAGAFRWRDEAFDVRARQGGPALAQIDRGALPAFGIQATGVHVNGLVGDQIWVGYRAADKALDPNKLDHLVAGGIPAGYTPEQTLAKEGKEEAGLPATLAAQARFVATIEYAMERAEGLRRDVLHCYDLELPPDFRPEPQDGEVSHFELWSLERALDTVRRTDDVKFNVNLVLIDLFIRRGLVTGDEAAALRAALTTPNQEE